MPVAGDAELEVDAREVSQPGGGDELESPYVVDGVLDLRAWARDALALALPNQILCRPDCAGLCAICGADLNEAGPEHGHERAPDPRWAKLEELEVRSVTQQTLCMLPELRARMRAGSHRQKRRILRLFRTSLVK